ncbi:MAG: citryl-CoA lyase, partial [Gammaproteobacteria bacterium]|nr:citryl-CoA lyase [Gammaproteobacteria bacterium]
MKLETVKSEFWQEVPEPDDPFGARICRCAGYDVYGELIQRASYIEVLYLIFCGERPTREAARMLQILAIALANPGPRDPMVHAAMSAGVGGSTHAACLMAALAVGAGQRGGARELVLAMEMFAVAGVDVVAWRAQFARGYARPFRDGWGELEHFPGFDPNAKVCALPVVQSLAALADRRRDGR